MKQKLFILITLLGLFGVSGFAQIPAFPPVPTKYTSVTTTMQSSATANGNGTVLAVDGQAAAVLTVNCSSCSGGTTINFEGQNDGTNFTPIYAFQLGNSNSASLTTTTSGLTYWNIPVAGFKQIRARISAYSAGTITVTGTTVPASNAYGKIQIVNTVDANVAQIGGSTVATAASGVQKVAIVDSSGTSILASTDPCSGSDPSYFNVTVAGTTAVELIGVPTGKTTYICGLHVHGNSTSTEIVSIIDGTQATNPCDTSPTALEGSTTAANGNMVAASGGGWSEGFAGATVLKTSGTDKQICALAAGTNRVNISGTYVTQ